MNSHEGGGIRELQIAPVYQVARNAAIPSHVSMISGALQVGARAFFIPGNKSLMN